MKKYLAAILVTIMLSGTAFAMPGWCMKDKGCHGRGLHHGPIHALKQLDLSDAQKHEIAVVFVKHREQGKEKAEAMHRSRQGLMEASEAEVFDETAVRQAYKAVATAGEEMAVHRAVFVAELRGILSPEQWQDFQEFNDARQERMGNRKEHNPRFIDRWLEINNGEDGNR